MEDLQNLLHIFRLCWFSDLSSQMKKAFFRGHYSEMEVLHFAFLMSLNQETHKGVPVLSKVTNPQIALLL